MKRGTAILQLIILLGIIFSPQKSVGQKHLLNEFAKQKNATWVFEKRKADSLANALSIPIYYVEKDNNKVVVLQRLGRKNKPIYYSTDNIDAAETISVDEVWNNSNEYPSLNGEGVEINLWDGGSIRASHQELQNSLGSRIMMRDLELPLSSHSTHIAGTMIASGVNAAAKGMAGNATIKAWDLNDDIAEMSGAAADGIVVSNHSYGPLCGWDYNSINESWYWYGDPDISATEDYEFGFYNQISADLDYIAQLAPNYLIVKSAGNDRNDGPTTSFIHYVWDETWQLVNMERDPDGGADGYDCLTPMAVAKNILTVGAVDDSRTIASFSAFGPTDDGRIKPDIVTNGFDIYSSSSSADDSYVSYNGTSMSAASATGSVALLNQLQNILQPGVQLLSSTIKGLLIHTASDLGNTGPDYSFGWGLLNIKEAADLIYANSHNQGKNIYEGVLVNDGETIIPVATLSELVLKITICWTDPAGQDSSPSLNSRNNKLVNDLDVLVENSNSLETYQPWILNVENPGAVATRNTNHVDNVEQIYIANPGDNDFNIKISHSGSLLGGSQKFSLIISGIETTSNIFPPKNLIFAINESSILLNWDSPDSGTPNLYKIYRNDDLLAVTENASFQDMSIVLDSIYEYYVTAEYELNGEKIESIGTNLISAFPQTLRSLPFLVDFEQETNEILIQNSLDGWQWGDSGSLNCYYLDFSDNTTKFIGADSYSVGDAIHVSDIAITAPLRLADYSNIILSFDYLLKTGIYDAIDELHVVYKLQEEKEWHELKELDKAFNWTYHSFELPPEMCKNGTQIGFYYDDLYQWGMGAGIDNIRLDGTLDIIEDLSLETINSPENIMCLHENPLDLGIEINNSGNTSILPGEIIRITTSCNGIQKINDYTLSQELNPGNSITITYQNLIDPLPVGNHMLIVEIEWEKDQNSTNNSISKTITINNLPEIIFINPPVNLCENGEEVELTAIPEGGTFAGDYLEGNTFNPSTAGVGAYEIIYMYTDINQCSNSESIVIEVLSTPEVSFTGLLTQYCSNEAPTLLIGNPSGGSFSGVGITDNYFDPEISGSGNFTIQYSYSDLYTCSNTTVQETYVQPQTELAFIGLEDSYCINNDPILLEGLPQGGIFYVDGIEQIYLIPDQSSSSSSEISYEYVDLNGCVSIIYKLVNILLLPEVTIEDVDEMYCQVDLDITPIGIPDNGVFTLDGEPIISFNPIELGEGNYELLYEYQSPNGCTGFSTQSFIITSDPSVSIKNIKPSYCPYEASVVLIGIPEGGYFVGDGVFNNVFSPSELLPGQYDITYYYDLNGCQTSTTATTQVTESIFASIEGLLPEYCAIDSLINIVGNPVGGVFTVTSISNEPSGVRSYDLFYSFTDNYNCTFSDTKTFTILPEPEVTLPSDLEFSDQDTVTINLENPEHSFVWPNDSTSKEIQLIGSSMPPGENTIYLIVQNELGCPSTFEFVFYIDAITQFIIDSKETKMLLYPNPANKSLNVLLPEINIVKLESEVTIRDINGKLIDCLIISQNYEDKLVLNVNDIPPGFYLLSLTSNGQIYRGKFIIHR